MVSGNTNNYILELNKGHLDLSIPKVMGVLNITPDSFYDGGKFTSKGNYINHVGRMITEGANIIDIGAVSTRPGAKLVHPDEELKRLMVPLKEISATFPDTVLSIDTYNSKVARAAIESGASIINDISGGTIDPDMFKTIGELKSPYILMHMQGLPENMQSNPVYSDVLAEIEQFFQVQLNKLASFGVNSNIVLDPGFGFGKKVDHNFQLLKNLGSICEMGYPVLAGISRKSMINKVLGTSPSNALNGTTVLNTVALLNGASILRVHDVKEAVETVKLINRLNL